MSAYYNEIDPYAAEWLRNLIKAGHIAPGFVDERSITDVKPEELRGYTQCHFFAGIGVWSLALRRAGWPDDKPVWTGSCPCQPFSAAGKGDGFTDERHLWPHWYHLITQCQPSHLFGEQVASKDGLGWLDLVQADLEGANYSSAAVDLCAAGVGAPHIRQRLWFVAERLGNPNDERLQGRSDRCNTEKMRETKARHCGFTSCPRGMADTRHGEHIGRNALRDTEKGDGREACTCEGAGSEGVGALNDSPICCAGDSTADGSCPTNSLWSDVDWLFCRDEKWRPVRPGSFPLVNGSPSRVGRLRAYGNAINAEAATQFIGAYLES